MSDIPPTSSRPRKRGRIGWLLAIAFLVVPLVEVYVLVQVGQVIGPWWTILLLIAVSVAGAWLVRREGARTWRALRTALSTGRMPAKELADGALVLIGGCLLLTPGFLTDIAGALLILPFTRPVFRRVLAAAVARRLIPVNVNRPGPRPQGPVVRGDVVDES